MAPPAPGKKHETLYEPRFMHPGVFIVPIVILPTLSLLAVIVVQKVLQRSLPGWTVPVVAVTSVLWLVVVWMLKLHAVRKVLRTHGRFLCLNCHYPLQGLADSGVCPECDHPYNRATTERRWRNWEESVNKGKPMV